MMMMMMMNERRRERETATGPHSYVHQSGVYHWNANTTSNGGAENKAGKWLRKNPGFQVFINFFVKFSTNHI